MKNLVIYFSSIGNSLFAARYFFRIHVPALNDFKDIQLSKKAFMEIERLTFYQLVQANLHDDDLI